MKKETKIKLVVGAVMLIIGLLILFVPTITANETTPNKKVNGIAVYNDIKTTFNGQKYRNVIFGSLQYKEKDAYLVMYLDRMLPTFHGTIRYNEEAYKINGFYFDFDGAFFGVWQLGPFSGWLKADITEFGK